MKKLILLFIVAACTILNAQWTYQGMFKFPGGDSVFATPMYMTTAENGRVYIASSKQASATSHDAIYYIDPGSNQIKRFIDFTEMKDTIMVWGIIGLTTIKNDLIVATRMHPSAFAGGCSGAYVFQNGDTAKKTGIAGVDGAPYIRRPGWGTFIYGIASTPDSTVFGGTAYQGGVIRGFNFRLSAPVNGNHNSVEYGKLIFLPGGVADDPTKVVPGGLDNKGFDRVRDCATVPGGDYTKPTTPWFTSRNSDTSKQTGNVAIWLGGHSKQPQLYSATAIQDNDNYLTLGSSIFYGLACDRSGRLWVAGIDTTRRWVIGFKVTVTTTGSQTSAFAELEEELPSATRFINSDPTGAPFNSPCDVTFSNDEKYAFVSDTWKRVIHVFAKYTTGNDKTYLKPNEFNLEQNFPNPFNPTTTIKYSLEKAANISIEVYDILGNKVATLYQGYKNAGSYTVNFDANGLASGMYICTMKANNAKKSIKMLLMK